MGQATSRVELGTAVLPIQTRHPVAMAQQVLSTQAVCDGRLTVGLGPSHHWIVEDMLGLSYDKPAKQVRDYLEVLNVAFAGPGPVDVENDSWRIHNPLDVTDLPPTPILLAALAPLMLRLAGEQTQGTILWMADQRAIGDHVVPKITAAAEAAGRPAPRIVAGVPGARCARTTRSTRYATSPTRCSATPEYSPNYQRLLEEGDARDVGDVLAAGDEAAVDRQAQELRRRRRHRPRRSGWSRGGPTARPASRRVSARRRSARRSPARSRARTPPDPHDALLTVERVRRSGAHRQSS